MSRQRSLVIGDKIFPSKNKVKEFVKVYLTKNSEIRQEDRMWVRALMEKHPEWARKSSGMSEIVLFKHRWCNAFGIKKVNGSIEDISYHACLDDVKQRNKERMLKSLRYAVQSQIDSYRSSTFDKNTICALCSTPQINNGSAHIDHIVPFRDLVKAFFSKMQITSVDWVSTGSYVEMTDPVMRREWETYHREHASLRILCGQCNLRRPMN